MASFTEWYDSRDDASVDVAPITAEHLSIKLTARHRAHAELQLNLPVAVSLLRQLGARLQDVPADVAQRAGEVC